MTKITCLMPIYNRVQLTRHPAEAVSAPASLPTAQLPEEALMSFLLQDHPDKELLICNDTPGQEIICDTFPSVRVLNVPYRRFPTLSDKLIYMIGLADSDILCRWDDDDISLPWRLSLSLKQLRPLWGNAKLEWRPANHWYAPWQRPYAETRHPGNTHNMALFTRACLDRIGGYPAKRSGDEDQTFNRLLAEAGINSSGELLKPSEIFYIYRWGVSQHLSGGGATPEQLQANYDRIGTEPILKGTFRLEPRWQRNYVRAAQEAAETLANDKARPRL